MRTNWGEVEPVAGRQCGSCHVCCVAMEIQDPELAKPANVPCHHLVEDKGCGIFEKWPVLCQRWFCGWRMMPGLPQGWRPDQSGILISPTHEPQPGYNGPAMEISLLNGSGPVMDHEFLCFVGGSIEKGIPLYFSLDVKGRKRFRTFLNTSLQEAVRTRNLAAVAENLTSIVEEQARMMQDTTR